MSHAGFKKDFVEQAILPDWWDQAAAKDQTLLTDLEVRVARFLGAPLAAVRDPNVALAVPTYPGAQLRKVREIDSDRLAPAIHAVIRIAEAVTRTLRVRDRGPEIPPADALLWRQQIARAGSAVTLDDLLNDLWTRGIPVIPVDILPAPSFQGAACIVENRPVIALGHKLDEPGRVAFLVAHETAHISYGDCATNQPVVDEEGEVLDDADIERIADRFAIRSLVGRDDVPQVDGATFKDLANSAARLEQEDGADASVMIFAWASRTGDYAKASMAVKALYRSSGARLLLRKHFDRHVDLDAATESDRALLNCVYGEPARNAAAD